MYSLKVITVLALVCVASTLAKRCFHGYCQNRQRVEHTGSCRNINHVPKINLTEAQGVFFQHRFPHVTNETVCDSGCITMHFNPTEDPNKFSVEMCCTKDGKSHCGEDVGNGFVEADPEKPAILKYTTNGETTKIYTLDTDNYESYSICYACVSKRKPLKPENIYILTRSPKLSAELEEHALELLKENGIDGTALIEEIKNDRCTFNGHA